jgi:hypothetical protein
MRSGRASKDSERLVFVRVLRRSAQVLRHHFPVENSTQKPPGPKGVKRPTIHHVVFFFVRVVFQSFLIADFPHLAGWLKKVDGTPALKKTGRRPPTAAGGKTNAGTLITPRELPSIRPT